ncbi:MAG: hypothetical protein ABL994_10725, partial [Verrucomicrobiales bacterium]
MSNPLVCLFTVLLVSSSQAQSAGVLREAWTGLPGNTIPDLLESPNYPGAPVFRVVDPEFRAPADWRDSYGLRMRAFLTPGTDGDYTFWISGDDNCELWLSTDATPEKRVRIARVPGATAAQVWTTYPEQKSIPVTLAGGQRYYIEALMKEGSGADNLSVAWATTPDATPVIIPGTNLTPFEIPAANPTGLVVEAGQEVRQHAPNLKVDLSAQTLDLTKPSRSATVAWTQVGGAAALIRTPATALTAIDLPGIGSYVFRATATNSTGTATDDVTVTILPKLAPDAGSALAEYWLG